MGCLHISTGVYICYLLEAFLVLKMMTMHFKQNKTSDLPPGFVDNEGWLGEKLVVQSTPRI